MTQYIEPIEPFELDRVQSIVLDRIISMISRKIEFMQQSVIPTHDAHQLDAYIHAHDVLEMHNCRNKPDLKEMVLQQKRSWITELDIPVKEYNQAINLVIDLLTKTYGNPIRHTEKHPVDKKRFVRQITLLYSLKSHRMPYQ